jgi:hypothetical protein
MLTELQETLPGDLTLLGGERIGTLGERREQKI